MLLPIAMFVALTLFMRFGPPIPFRKLLHEHLVERPLRWLLTKRRHDILYLLIVTAMLLGGGEVLLLMGPELALGFAADLALYVDVMAVSYLLAAVAGAKAALRAVRARVTEISRRAARLLRSKGRRRTSRVHRPPARADNDDDEHPGAWRAAA
jgi:hypothetical protein